LIECHRTEHQEVEEAAPAILHTVEDLQSRHDCEETKYSYETF